MTEIATGTSRWEVLETWSATAFLIAGLLWLFDTVLLGIELFASVSVLGTPGMVNPILYLSGLVAAIIGLFGLYPGLASRTPRLARVSVRLLAVGGVAIPVLLVWFVTVNLLNQPDPPGVLLILTILLVALGIILFGIASVWTAIPSRTVGLYVLMIPVTLLALFLVFVISGGDPPDWPSPAVGVVVSVLLLAIGFTLRTEGVLTDRAESAPTEVGHD